MFRDGDYQKVFSYGAVPAKVSVNASQHQIWDPVEARFTPRALRFVVAIPALVTALVLLCQSLRPIWKLRPQWLKEFNKPIPPKLPKATPVARRASYPYLALLCIALIGFAMQILALVWPDLDIDASYSLAAWFITIVWIIIRRPKTAPALLLLICISILTSNAIILCDKSSGLQKKDTPVLVSATAALLAIFVIIMMPLRDPRTPDEMISRPFETPTSELSSPEDNLTLWQFLTMSWMSAMISVGAARQLNDGDVWTLSHEFQHTDLYENFRQLPGSVLRKLLRANGLDLILISLLGILEMCANLSVPALLQQLLRSMEDARSPKSATLTYAFLILIVRLIAVQSAVMSLWSSRRAYEKSRGEMITLLHEKTLTRKIVGNFENESDDAGLAASENGHAQPPGRKASRSFWQRSQDWLRQVRWALYHAPKKLFAQRRHLLVKVKQPASKGKILNILRNDAYEVAQRFWEFPDLITKPLGLVLSIILIWQLIGWPCLIGAAAVVVAQILNAFVARMLMKWERYRRVITDTKLQKIAEVVEAIRHLRWYAWQDAWLTRILEERQRELNYRVITGLWGILISLINNLSSGLFPVIAFWAYTTLAGLPLPIDVIFPALQLFGMLKSNLREIPNLITVLLNASVAMGRINDFMNEPDLPQAGKDPETDHLSLESASFAWPGSDVAVLKDITASFPTGITLVCGKVAAGKSALLQALLGELDQLDGKFSRPNEVFGYCSQMPWLQNMSIRDNILFYSPYEASRYRQVIEACALLPDLTEFEHGDLSSIGENGIGLSGGQKARVALARAVYNPARIILLDDPISALDHTTTEFIVQKCFRGPLMENRIVVLVTHRVDTCRGAAVQILQVADGKARLLDMEEHWLGNGSLQTNAGDNALATEKGKDSDAIPENYTVEEYRAHGGVKFSVYWTYIKAGKLHLWFILICVLSVNRLAGIASSWFLKAWGEGYDGPKEFVNSQSFLDRLPPPYRDVQPWLIAYLVIVLCRAFIYFIAQLLMLLLVYISGKRIFNDVMHRVCYATFRFYDITPVGRLMNRLTSDIGTIDGNISRHLSAFGFLIIAWLFSVAVIASVTPKFLAFSAVLTIACVLIFKRFLPTAQSLRRLEMVSLSPLMSNFGVLLDGLMTVRAFRAEQRFQARLIAVVDSFQKMDHFYWTLHEWLMWRLDGLAAFSTLILTGLAVYGNVSPGLTAFTLIAANKFVEATHGLCKQYGKLQMDFVSVERVVELLYLDQEPAGTPVPASWPSLAPSITFSNVTIRYTATSDPALSSVSLTLRGGTNTAIIGRTGSGKSTFALAILATVRPEAGNITIDGVDVATADTAALRSRIAFVAQDPVLFPGSLRDNLDPLHEHSDGACAAVLAKVAARHGWGLGTRIDTHGKNLSQGQRQLVGLARAVLRRAPIVILDEATASIDQETSLVLQQVLREELSGATVITIAHRLEAVKGADYCVVLSKGEVVRQGTAKEILNSAE